MIQRHQENDLYMTMMMTTTMAVPEDDGGSITSTMSTTTNTATTLSSSITSSSSSSKKKKKITKKTKKSSRSQSSKHHDNVTPTMIVTKPAQFDILCGKDKTYNKHAGNQVFRAMIETWVKAYQQATTKQEKMRITKQIVHSLQVQFESRFLKPAVTAAASDASLLGGGGGVEQWTEISNQVARDKVSHALRFAAKQQQTLVKTAMLQAKNLPKQKFSMSPSRPVAARPTTVAKKASQKPTVVGVDDDDEGVESLFQLQQAILLGSLNANNKNKNNNSSGIRQQPQHYAAEEQHADEPEFNTLRSEDLNALLDEPVMLENDYDTLMSLSK